MSVSLTYPGVYIQEVPSGVRTITGVATSITAFLGQSLKGPLDTPIRIQSFAEFETTFGGLWVESSLGYAVQQYFLNGGAEAIVVRVASDDGTAASVVATTADAADSMTFAAANVGAWGNNVEIQIDHATANPADDLLYNLTAIERVGTSVIASETYRNISASAVHPRAAVRVLAAESKLIRITDPSGKRPLAGTIKLAAVLRGRKRTSVDIWVQPR